MRPKFEKDIVSCPDCGALDNIGMVSEDEIILWCSCGKVYRMHHEDHSMTEYRVIADMVLPMDR